MSMSCTSTQTIVIVESPSKCKKIEEFLGPGHKCIATFGVVRQLDGISSINPITFEPTYIPCTEAIKKRQISNIKECCKSTFTSQKIIVLATDDDREGEAIAWHTAMILGLPLDTKRVVFHEITRQAVIDAMSKPRVINMNLVHAQQARQIIDMLIGFKISPMLWKEFSYSGSSVGSKGSKKSDKPSLSAGRCQTPALRVVYENQQAINNSNANTLEYKITATFTKKNIMFVLNRLLSDDANVAAFMEKEKSQICTSEHEGGNNSSCVDPVGGAGSIIQSHHHTRSMTIGDERTGTSEPPHPLKTTTLQQLANSELHLSPKATMCAAQELYEQGHITYMRTDCDKYSHVFIQTIRAYISRTYGDIILNANDPNKDRYIFANIWSLQIVSGNELAHEAIRPTVIDTVVVTQSPNCSATAVKLYKLIRDRTLESCMAAARFLKLKAGVSAPNGAQYEHEARRTIFDGWLAVKSRTQPRKDKSDNSSAAEYAYLLSLKGQICSNPGSHNVEFRHLSATATVSGTKRHICESGLVGELETKGIGRPSTFATLVDKIQERNYAKRGDIEGIRIGCNSYELDLTNPTENKLIKTPDSKIVGAEKNRLIIQPIGVKVIEYLLTGTFNNLFDYQYTSKMETELDLVAAGNKNWVDVCSECSQLIASIVATQSGAQSYNTISDGNGATSSATASASDYIQILLGKVKNISIYAIKTRTETYIRKGGTKSVVSLDDWNKHKWEENDDTSVAAALSLMKKYKTSKSSLITQCKIKKTFENLDSGTK